MMKILLITLCLLFLLPGCASLNSDFDCPVKPGVMCKSLDEVNSGVDRHAMGSSVRSPSADQFSVPPDAPARYAETIMPIWIAPYEDAQGNYHNESKIFTVVKPGYWGK